MATLTGSTHLVTPTPEALDSFRGQLRAGDTAGAFAAVKTMRPGPASMLMLLTGFSVIDHRGRNLRNFWEKVQSDIVNGCRAHKDGFEMRE